MKTDKKYIKPEANIITFDKEDIIAESGVMPNGTFGEDEVP